MAYYENDFAGKTDATGAATIELGPLSEKDLYFLGYAVVSIAGGSGCTAIITTKNGYPLAGASGLLPSVGPFSLKPNEFKYLQITSAPANAVVTGNIIGDVSPTVDGLLVRPQPTQAGQTLTGTTFAQIAVSGNADFQGGLQVEGAAKFWGDPWFDITHPNAAGGAKGDGVADDGPAIRAAIVAASAVHGKVLIPSNPPVAFLVLSDNSPSELFLIQHACEIVGDGWGSEIRVGGAIGAATDVFRLAPAASLFAPDVTMHLFRDFRITAAAGTPARNGIYFDASAANAFLRQFEITNVWIDPLGGRAVACSATATVEGSIFIAVVRRSNLANGVQLLTAGDSLTIEDNVIYGTHGIDAALINGAGLLVCQRNNVTGADGIQLKSGLSCRFRDNNVQLVQAYTGPNGALVDMAGTPGVSSLVTCEVDGNEISVLPGGGAIDALRIDTAIDTAIDHNYLTAPLGNSHIKVTANASRTRIGKHNSFNGAGTPITNAGAMTEQQSAPLLYSQVADSGAISNTLAETAFNKTFTIPGNTLRPGDIIRIRASGVYSTGVVAPNLTLRARIGAQGTNATTIAALAGQAGDNWRIEADTFVRTIGAAGNLEGAGGFVSILTASGTGSPSNTVSDTTNNLVVDVTATWSVADAADTITMQTLLVELLRAGTVS